MVDAPRSGRQLGRLRDVAAAPRCLADFAGAMPPFPLRRSTESAGRHRLVIVRWRKKPHATCRFHLSGKSPKVCPALCVKIFCFRSHANQRHNSACLTHRGTLAIVTNVRWDAMDAKRAQASGRGAYGEVVWFGRRGAGVKSGKGESFSRGDGGKRAVLREEHEVSRKAIAQGRPGCSSCPVCSCARFL